MPVSSKVSAASTNSTLVKGAPGTVTGIVVTNINAAARYFRLYDKATAPTAGTDTPKFRVSIPPAGVVAITGLSMSFGVGIGYAMTASGLDSSSDAVSASEHQINVMWG